MVQKGQKILVADDSTFMRIIIKKLLAENGYLDIVEAENGRGAIDVFEKEKPDLTILDIIMPAMGGDVVLKKLMKMNKNAKVIMITAVGQEEIMEEKKLMTNFFENLAKTPGKVSYGEAEVMKNLKTGVVDILLLSESLKDEKLESFEKEAELVGTKVNIISTETREGVQLKNLGKIAAILRYEVK